MRPGPAISISDGARGKEKFHCPNFKLTHRQITFGLGQPAQLGPKSPAPKLNQYGGP